MTSPKKQTPRHDDGLEWLREVRRQLAEEVNYDPFEDGRRLRELEALCPERIYQPDPNDHIARVGSKRNARKPKDDGLEWLRQVRREILAECGNDPKEVGRRLRELEKTYTGRVIYPPHESSAIVAEEPPEK